MGPGPASALFNAREKPDKVPLENLVPTTHWKKGALIGGTAASAAWLLWILPPFIRGEDSDLGVAFLAATPAIFILGAIPGALIGGQFPRDAESPR